MNAKTTNIVFYCTFIGWIIAAAAGDSENSSLNHKNQGFVIGIICLFCAVIGNAFWWVPVLGMILGIVLNLISVIMLVFTVLGIINAVNDEDKLLPFICAIRPFKE